MGRLAAMESVANEIVTDVAIWSKQSKAWGSARRIQRNYYAFQVAMAMTKGEWVCAAGCGNDLDLDTAEVDRAIPTLDYRPGNIVTICHGCNHGRGVLQSNGGDWRHAHIYAADIKRASVGIPIPSVADARLWWDSRPTVATRPRYA